MILVRKRSSQEKAPKSVTTVPGRLLSPLKQLSPFSEFSNKSFASEESHGVTKFDPQYKKS